MAEDWVAWREGDAAVVGDARFFPVIVSTWFGTACEQTVRPYFAWNDALMGRAGASASKFVSISDARKALSPPATIRRLLSELSDNGPEATRSLSLCSIVVLESALVRGALTAVQWLTRRETPLTTMGTMTQAIQRALASLASAGVPSPAGLTAAGWVAPELPPRQGTTVLR